MGSRQAPSAVPFSHQSKRRETEQETGREEERHETFGKGGRGGFLLALIPLPLPSLSMVRCWSVPQGGCKERRVTGGQKLNAAQKAAPGNRERERDRKTEREMSPVFEHSRMKSTSTLH